MNSDRKWVFQAAFILVSLVLLARLFALQALNSRYSDLAESNAILREIAYPHRGLIYDRNGKLIVYNTPEYDIYLIDRELGKVDSARFCEVFMLTAEALRSRFAAMHKRKEYSPEKPTLFLGQIANTEFARMQDRLDNFSGLNVQVRTTRSYVFPGMANALGYVSEISKKQLELPQYSDYSQGDYVGKSGIESFYETYLRGKRGMRFKLRNVRGIEKGRYEHGRYDIAPIPGKNLTSTIDIDLQQYGKLLMQGKSGSIVAIEPASGEILALVSAPSYDPSLLTGRGYSKNFARISVEANKPLFNRPLMAQYRPGSIFKIAQAMTALQQGVITPETRIRCNRSIIACHGNHSMEDLKGAIANSCNPYFYEVFKRMINPGLSESPYNDARAGLATWDKYIASFGFGSPLGVDLFGEKGGLIATPQYYDKAYHDKPWKFSNIFSLAIGEGENLVAPIQMANFAAIIANRGYYHTPHLIRAIDNGASPLPEKYIERRYTAIDSAHFSIAVDAMQQVVDVGTGQYRAKLKSVIVCGKTGTVQNTPRPDHSVFIAFAPRDAPRIALSVYVENAGQGARAAAAIASLMIEKYLLGGTERPYVEEYVLKGEFGQ